MQPLLGTTGSDQFGDISRLAVWVHVIEFQDHRVALTATDTRMGQQVVEHDARVSYTLRRSVATIALNVCGRIRQVMVLRSSTTTLFALAVALSRRGVLQRELLALPQQAASSANTLLQHETL
jgi:hypothetical protein